MSSPADLGIEYTSGMLAPDAGSIGLLPFVDDTGVNFRYGRVATPPARDGAGVLLGQDQIELIPQIKRFTSTTTTPTLLRTVVIPRGAIATIRIELHADDAGDLGHFWRRYDFQTAAESETTTQVGATIDEKPSINGIGAISVTFAINPGSVDFFFTGPADPINVLAIMRADVYFWEQPIET